MYQTLQTCVISNHSQTVTADSQSCEQRLNFLKFLSAKERKLYKRIPDEMDYVFHPSFASGGEEERLFSEDSQVPIPRWTYLAGVSEEIPPPPAKTTVLSREDERTLFLSYNYARYRLSKLIETQSRLCTPGRAQQMVHWFSRSLKVRADLVEANMPLVLTMVKYTNVTNVEFSELVSEGNMALLRSVDKFDVSRGYKFSTYACRSILKSFSRMAVKTQRYRRLFPVEFDPCLQRSDYIERRRQTQREDSIEALREILAKNRAELTNIEQTVVQKRFPMRAEGKKRPLIEIAKAVGLSKERVRQIQKSAIRKIRSALEEQAYIPVMAKT